MKEFAPVMVSISEENVLGLKANGYWKSIRGQGI